MSCHFHIMRRRKAALKATEAAESGKKEKAKAGTTKAEGTAKKAAESGKKASTKKGDAK